MSDDEHKIYERLATLETQVTNIREEIKTRANEATWIKRSLFGTFLAITVDLLSRFQGGAL